jgi:hypothetical protein
MRRSVGENALRRRLVLLDLRTVMSNADQFPSLLDSEGREGKGEENTRTHRLFLLNLVDLDPDVVVFEVLHPLTHQSVPSSLPCRRSRAG